jgi:chromosome partitioning protein
MTHIVGFVSQKGGTGKTTLACALARDGAAGGLAVKIADLDLQQKTSYYWNVRRLEAGIEPRISVEAFKTAKQALAVAKGLDLMVIDGPARASEGTLEIARAAGLIVQPCGASLADLDPAIDLFREMTHKDVPRFRMVIALSKIGTDAEEADARRFIEQAGFDVLRSVMPERPALRQIQNQGYAVNESRYASLTARLDPLLQDIIDRVEGANG